MSETAKAVMFFLLWAFATFARVRLAHHVGDLPWTIGIIVSAACSATMGIFIYRAYLGRKANRGDRPR